MSDPSRSRKVAVEQPSGVEPVVIHQPSAATRRYAGDVPADPVAISKFLLFALQKPYES